MEPNERTLVIISVVAVGIVAALLMLPRRASHMRVRLPGWVTAGAVFLCLGLGIGYAAAEFWGLHWTSGKSEAAAPPMMSLTPVTPAGAPLAAGTKMPALSTNWLNGAPPNFGDPAVELFVIDLFSPLCPFCQSAAPKFVEIYPKYKARGVSFMSLSKMSKEWAQGLVKSCRIEWPFMYEGPSHLFDGIQSAGSNGMVAGEGTLYSVARDGTVLWHDNRGRLHHELTEEYVTRVCQALDQFLAANARK